MTTDVQDAPTTPLAQVIPGTEPAGYGLTRVQQPARLATPAVLIEMHINSGQFDPDWVERMMKLDREYKADLAREAFNQAFADFKALNIVVPKSKHVQQKAKNGGPGPSFWQSEMHVVAQLLQPALAQFGLSYRYVPVFLKEGATSTIRVTCILQHAKGHTESVTLEGPPDTSGAKNPLQELQSSSTFLQRHTVLAITGTAQVGQDNDGRGARGYRDDGDVTGGGTHEPEEQRPGLEALNNTGQEKATQGLAVLRAWYSSLTQGERELLGSHFGALTKAARRFDEGGA